LRSVHIYGNKRAQFIKRGIPIFAGSNIFM
jgi:hypothetical protein